MRARVRRRAVLGGLAGGAFAAWAAAGPAPGLRVPPLAPVSRRLRNGLVRVALPSGRTSGTVAVQLWYRVGGRDDPPGRSGFAHLFEHMMFKRTRHLEDEAFDRLTEDVGGDSNAFTDEDVTVYLNVVPSAHLERIVWAEAERMGGLRVDEAAFRSERAVVQAEFRDRVLADPYGLLFHGMAPALWQAHPYRRPVIGRIEDLEAATLDDVRAFHAAHYRPDNATLIVAGDFDLERLDTWVDRHFGALRLPAAPVPRTPGHEPRRDRDHRVVLAAPQVPAPALALMWPGPAAADGEAPALRVAAALLGEGESSRLVGALVERDRLAQGAGFSVDLHAEAGMLSAWAIAAGPAVVGADARLDPRLARLEEALMREVHRLAHGRIAPAELDKVRLRLLTEALVARQTAEGQALAAGWAQVHHGDPAAADAEPARLMAVQADDVQQALRRHVLQAHRVVLGYVQAVRGGGGEAR